jgi:hypothetical protein
MKILEYTGLDTTRVEAQYRKVVEAIARDDFRSAEVKKLAGLSHGKFYRARLDYANRLLFSLVRHHDEVCALMLEVIEHHAYDKSRFLRGAAIDEAKIPETDVTAATREAQPLRYLHPERTQIHLLDKPISFDDAQQTVYLQHPPLIVVGSAGSGKTALTLEKLKHADGEVLYVTHSAYLAQNARDLYYANGFEHPGQEATFLSYREFLETLRVPSGREASWQAFAGWFARLRQSFKGVDAHQAFEEIRGVITANADGILSRAQYQGLGVRQSIFPEAMRGSLYDLYEKYRAWLAAGGLYDLNLLAHERLALAAPRYDFIVIDEVQDLTIVQLALVLKTLARPGHFLLCGDSNQIVHPNFFSWTRVKGLFWRDEELAAKQELRVLSANFRNGAETTRLANTLLKIKHRRFGSIDRESNFLVQAVGGEQGKGVLLPDTETVTRDIDHKTRQSAQVAVLVMRDEDKAAARRVFGTPLLFSVHEAKGLEYETIVLYRYVSDHRAEFAELVAGVRQQDLSVETLEYRRARDKTDKSLEVYKFFVNALYVAMTRAVKNLYLIESDTAHPLFALLDVGSGAAAQVEAQTSSREDWQKEARRLELQGKQEQAEAIRRDILRQSPPPWPVFDEVRLRETLAKVFREQAPGSKQKQQLYEYAACYREPVLAGWLASEANFGAARGYEKQPVSLGRKGFASYYAKNIKDILRQCDQYGIEHRTPMNQTPLMAAARAGNVPLLEALLARGADPLATDHYGHNALHLAMQEAFDQPAFAHGPFAAIHELVAPASVDVQAGERLVRIDRHLAEYFLFQTLWVLFKSRFTHLARRPTCAFDTAAVLSAWEHMPANVVRPERNKRTHISSVLSRNEIDREYAYNRALFWRVAQGWYQFNPALAVRRRVAEEERWLPVYQALNLPLIHEFTPDFHWERAQHYLARATLPPPPVPVAAERRVQRLETQARERAEQEAARRAALEKRRRPAPVNPEPPADDPPWGTPAAKRLAIERLRERNARRRNQDKDD